jgi:ribosomal protein S18 acetylase RimI-like enzyme
MTTPVLMKLVTEPGEVEQIKELQNQNLRLHISDEVAASEGFLTASYTMEYLQAMNADAPSVIAKAGDEVVGYAMVTTQALRDGHDLMADLFNTIDRTSYGGRLLCESDYVVVGQLCVAKEFRGLGLVQQLYNHFKNCYADRFEYLVTDVAQANIRSLKAHKKSGFQVIDTLTYGGIGWDIVLWDWRRNS